MGNFASENDNIIGDLIVVPTELPTVVQELPDFIKSQTVRLDVLRVAIKSGQLPVNKFDELLLAGQELGEKILDAKIELGKVLLNAPSGQGKRTDLENEDNLGTLGNEVASKKEAMDKLNLNKKQSKNYTEMAEHPNAVQKVKEEARENREIPTEYAVIKKIKELTKTTEPSKGGIHGSPAFEKDKIKEELSKVYVVEKDKDFNINMEGVKLNPVTVMPMDGTYFFDWCPPYDLMITQPEYQKLDDLDISEDMWVDMWLSAALSKMKPTGSAYIFMDGNADNLRNFLNAPVPDGVYLDNILVWAYNDSTASSDSNYNDNYFNILYYRGKESPQMQKEYNTLRDSAILGNFESLSRNIGLLIMQSSKKGDIVVDPFCSSDGYFAFLASVFERKTYEAKYEDLDSEGAIEKSKIFEWLKNGWCQLGSIK